MTARSNFSMSFHATSVLPTPSGPLRITIIALQISSLLVQRVSLQLEKIAPTVPLAVGWQPELDVAGCHGAKAHIDIYPVHIVVFGMTVYNFGRQNPVL